MIVYVENYKESTKDLLEIVSEFRQINEINILIQKLILFLFIRNTQLEKEVKRHNSTYNIV